jgi:hypothetical protein
MSRIGNLSSTGTGALLFSAAVLFIAPLSPAHAQYVGRVDANQDSKQPTLRATAVLEYTGDLTKPNASRLIPIAVWDGERYQPGGLYMAQPVPLTVESGTQYVLQVAGTPKGLFDVKGAADMGGSWVGVGSYQKPTPPNYAKLRRSPHLPRIEDDKPHFAHVPVADTNPGSGNTKSTTQNNSHGSAPDVDPERPTLHQRTDSGSTPGSSSGTTSASAPASNADPDRPTLHHHSASPSSGSNGERETATETVDPDRPRLGYGRPAELESLDAPAAEIAKLAKTPADLEQIAAVSDAANRPQHSYVYSWSDPDEEKKTQAALEAVAQNLLAKSAPAAAKPTPKPRTGRTAAHRKPSKPGLPALTDEQLKAYELSYGGGATLVFSATTGQGDAARYITLIAQPDFNGTPLVLFKQVTTERDLNVIPRMKLIDAIDTDADNRAELIFALETNTGRQYAIYRVANNTVEQVFTTGT